MVKKEKQSVAADLKKSQQKDGKDTKKEVENLQKLRAETLLEILGDLILQLSECGVLLSIRQGHAQPPGLHIVLYAATIKDGKIVLK